MSPKLEDAIALAAMAHHSQYDKIGVPYILHPLRVMDKVRNESVDHMIVAVLHDTIEDTPLTLKALEQLGYPDYIIAALDALTRRVSAKEPYRDFILRAKANPIARVVKIADIQDNTSSERTRYLSKTDRNYLNKKYEGMEQLLRDID